MPEAITTKNEALDRLVAMFREKLESAFRNGQRVRMTAHDGASTSVPWTVFEHSERPITEMLSKVEPDGRFELHVYIEAKRR